MASLSRSILVSESSSSNISSDSDRETILQGHKKRMKAILSLFTPEKVQTFFQPPKRQYIKREREQPTQQIWRDYFAENPIFPPEIFHRRFRMCRELFLHILNDITNYDDFFKHKPDAIGRLGCTPIQKMTAAIRILAYGISVDLCGEYIKVGERTAIQSLKKFCDAIIALYAERYQRSPNEDDIARLLREGEERGFPGMFGSIDCMHWKWKNCPTVWHGTHKGRSHKSTLILEAVASKDLWMWHAFFGMVSSHNDLNVLDHSPVFNGIINGTTPPVNYEVNGHRRTLGYYLADGIYPKWATLMQTIMHPTTGKEKLFAQKQEAARKDVE